MIDPTLDALFDEVLPEPEPDPPAVPYRKPPYVKLLLDDRDLFYLQEFIATGNAAQSARTAGFSETVAKAHSHHWIRPTREESSKPLLWDMWIEHKNKRLSSLDLTEDRLLTEYARLALFDPGKMFDDNGGILHPKDMDEDTRRAVQGFDVTDSRQFGRMIKIKMADKRAALDSIAQIKGMKKDEVKVIHSFQQLLTEIEDDAAAEPLVVGEGVTDACK